METIWWAGFLFTMGYIDLIGKDETIEKIGKKGMALLLATNALLIILCIIAWPWVLGVDVKRTMVDGRSDD